MFVVCQSGRRAGKATFMKENYYMPECNQGQSDPKMKNISHEFANHFVHIIRNMRTPQKINSRQPTMNDCLVMLKEAIDRWKPPVDFDNVKAEI